MEPTCPLARHDILTCCPAHDLLRYDHAQNEETLRRAHNEIRPYSEFLAESDAPLHLPLTSALDRDSREKLGLSEMQE